MKRFFILLVALTICSLPSFGQQIFYYNIADITLHSGDTQNIQVDSPINAIITASQAPLTIRVDNSTGITVSAMNTNCEVLMDGAYPAALNINDIIKSTAAWQKPTNETLLSGGSGNWQNATGSFLGVRIKESGLWYYGWIRMGTCDTGNIYTATIYDYACNMQQGDSIYAGEIAMNAVTNVNTVKSMNVVCVNKKLSITGTKGQNCDLMITDMSGRTIARYNYQNGAIDLSDLADGIYIITVRIDDFRKRFKILL